MGRDQNFEVARSLVADRLKLAREEIKRFGSGQAAMANAARMPGTQDFVRTQACHGLTGSFLV